MSITSSPRSRTPNKLLNATSPYLRQHAYNPVDWRQWDSDTLAAAKERDLPIFLSIGYAACHWCHVMERESFEHEVIAKFLNEHFVCIKVDREERPDLDHLYMTFTQAMTGSGGWPMSVWLTPDLKPFYAGTYFPAEDHYGRPGFLRLITELSRLWAKDREQIFASAEEITNYIRAHLQREVAPSPLSADLMQRAAEGWMKRYDTVYGGFGSAPKFPHPTELSLLLRYGLLSDSEPTRQALQHSLEQLIRGGIYDQIGGGIHRYSVDVRWLVPHFEKMLYDNALLLSVMAEFCLTVPHAEIARAIDQTISFLMREIHEKFNSGGAFYSGIDADSEGEEGKFYVWSLEEFSRAVGENATGMQEYFNVTAAGNFEGHTIVHRSASSAPLIQNGELSQQAINHSIDALLLVRGKRIRPVIDTKLLTSWNGLLVAGFIECALATSNETYGKTAVEIANFIQEKLWDGSTLHHGLSDGVIIPGEQLEDYAYLLFGLSRVLAADSQLSLSSDTQSELYRWSRALAHRALSQFMDGHGRCYLRPENTPHLLIRPQENSDGALPSPVGMLTRALITLSRLTGEMQFRSAAEKIIKALSGELTQYPDGMASMVMAQDELTRPSVDVVMVGNYDVLDIAKLRRHYFLYGVVVLHSTDGQHPSILFEGRRDVLQRFYVCSNNVCQSPVTTIAAAQPLIEQLIRKAD